MKAISIHNVTLIYKINFVNIAILFAIGSIFDEAQGNHDLNSYILERKCSRARSLIVLQWTLVGFLLTTSYKSILRSNMMKMEYDITIETIDDVLQSDRTFLVAGFQRALLMTDTREKVKQLTSMKLVDYNVFPKIPPWTNEW